MGLTLRKFVSDVCICMFYVWELTGFVDWLDRGLICMWEEFRNVFQLLLLLLSLSLSLAVPVHSALPFVLETKYDVRPVQWIIFVFVIWSVLFIPSYRMHACVRVCCIQYLYMRVCFTSEISFFNRSTNQPTINAHRQYTALTSTITRGTLKQSIKSKCRTALPRS